MTLRTRLARLEARSLHRLRILFASEAEAALTANPKRPGETVIVLPNASRLL